MDLVGSAPPAAAPPSAARYVTRLLPPEEWARLVHLPFATHGLPDANSTILFVTESEGEIVGIWGIFLQPMLDGLWVDPEHRHTPIASQLLATVKTFMQAQGVSEAFTQISDPQVMILAHKAGFTRAPGDLWQLHVPRLEDL